MLDSCNEPYRRWYMKIVDLFSGCGGMSLGFQRQGFDVCAAFDWWEPAIICYAYNFTHTIHKADLSQVDKAVNVIRPYEVDGIIGGPPCQDFSHAGKRIESSRAELTECYAKIVAAIKPKFFVMENVDRAQKSATYLSARKIFKKAGYGLTEIVLDASLCGVPQKRKRFICFGVKDAPDNFALFNFTREMSSRPMTLRDFFGNTLGFEYYYRHPRNYSRRAVFSIDEPAPTMRGVNRPIPQGYTGNKNDACPISSKVHALSSKERALIQTFPSDFKWVGNKTDIEQMIGNAVPVNLAQYVAKVVKQTLKVDND